MKFAARIVLLLLATSLACCGEDITIAAASDLQFAFKDVASRFEKETGNSVRLSFGSSGNFFGQIQSGAPFDLFFSADMAYPQKLDAAGLAEAGSLYQFATGAIVLWVRRGSGLDVNRGLQLLLDPWVRKLAIANPAHAPYGRAAEAALRHEGLWDKLKKKLVLGENISQTFQFVESGHADAGILALSLAMAPEALQQGSFFLIPRTLYPPLQQAGIILKSSRHKVAAQQFMQFIRGKEISELMKRYGFAPAIAPESDHPERPQAPLT